MNRFEKIPEALKSLDQWVCIHGNSKIPMKAFEHKAASSIEPETWSPFAIAEQAVAEGRYENLGFVFHDNGIVGIDIDAGYDEDGFLTPTAADIIGKCGSYTERSRSGKGFHILLYGDIPFKGKNNLRGVEMYKTARYFIMTGDVTLFDTVEENQSAIDYVIDTYFPDCKRENSSHTNNRVYTPVWEKPMGSRIRLRPIYPRIPQGCRNVCLTSLAGMLHNQGYSPEQIFEELLYCNAVACDPILDSGEIQTIVNSVTRYKR